MNLVMVRLCLSKSQSELLLPLSKINLFFLIQAHDAVTAASRKRSVEEYVKRGKKLSDWEVWTALETYLQVSERTDKSNLKEKQ